MLHHLSGNNFNNNATITRYMSQEHNSEWSSIDMFFIMFITLVSIMFRNIVQIFHIFSTCFCQNHKNTIHNSILVRLRFSEK